MQNMNGDQLGALQVTNTGTTPLWVRLIAPVTRTQPLSHPRMFCRLNAIFWQPTAVRNRSSLKSGELVLVWLEVKASQNVPDALVVDLSRRVWSWRTRTRQQQRQPAGQRQRSAEPA